MIEHEIGPFAIVPLWVMDALVEAGQPEAIRLYVQLHHWTSGDDRSCYPARRTIAESCGVSTDTIDRYVKVLQSIGALRVEPREAQGGGCSSNRYTLVVARPSRTDAATGTSTAAPSRTDAAEGGRTDAPAPSRTDAAQTRPSEQDPVEPDPHTAADGGGEVVDHPTLVDAFEAFWATYEKTGPRKKAWECWRRAVKKDQPEAILAGLQRWMTYWRSPGATRMKWPQGWLNDETWKDEPPPIRASREAENPYLDLLRSGVS